MEVNCGVKPRARSNSVRVLNFDESTILTNNGKCPSSEGNAPANQGEHAHICGNESLHTINGKCEWKHSWHWHLTGCFIFSSFFKSRPNPWFNAWKISSVVIYYNGNHSGSAVLSHVNRFIYRRMLVDVTVDQQRCTVSASSQALLQLYLAHIRPFAAVQ